MDSATRSRIKKANARRSAARKGVHVARQKFKGLSKCIKHAEAKLDDTLRAGTSGLDALGEEEQEFDAAAELTPEEQEEYERMMAAEQQDVLGALEKQGDKERMAAVTGLSAVAGVFTAVPILRYMIRNPWMRKSLIKLLGEASCGICGLGVMMPEKELQSNVEADRMARRENQEDKRKLKDTLRKLRETEGKIELLGEAAKAALAQQKLLLEKAAEEFDGQIGQEQEIVFKRLRKNLATYDTGGSSSANSAPMRLVVEALHAAGHIDNLTAARHSPAILLQQTSSAVRNLLNVLATLKGDKGIAQMVTDELHSKAASVKLLRIAKEIRDKIRKDVNEERDAQSDVKRQEMQQAHDQRMNELEQRLKREHAQTLNNAKIAAYKEAAAKVEVKAKSEAEAEFQKRLEVMQQQEAIKKEAIAREEKRRKDLEAVQQEMQKQVEAMQRQSEEKAAKFERILKARDDAVIEEARQRERLEEERKRSEEDRATQEAIKQMKEALEAAQRQVSESRQAYHQADQEWRLKHQAEVQKVEREHKEALRKAEAELERSREENRKLAEARRLFETAEKKEDLDDANKLIHKAIETWAGDDEVKWKDVDDSGYDFDAVVAFGDDDDDLDDDPGWSYEPSLQDQTIPNDWSYSGGYDDGVSMMDDD